MMFVVCRKDMVCMNEEDRKLQIAMGAHMKQLIGQLFASFSVIFYLQHVSATLVHIRIYARLHCTSLYCIRYDTIRQINIHSKADEMACSLV